MMKRMEDMKNPISKACDILLDDSWNGNGVWNPRPLSESHLQKNRFKETDFTGDGDHIASVNTKINFDIVKKYTLINFNYAQIECCSCAFNSASSTAQFGLGDYFSRSVG
jgi:hypothetical protein